MAEENKCVNCMILHSPHNCPYCKKKDNQSQQKIVDREESATPRGGREQTAPAGTFNLSEKRKDILNNMLNNYPDINIGVFKFMLGLVERQDCEFIRLLKMELRGIPILEDGGEFYQDFATMSNRIDKLAGSKLI